MAAHTGTLAMKSLCSLALLSQAFLQKASADCVGRQFAAEIQQAGFLLRKAIASSLAVRGRQFQLPPPAGLYKRHGGFWKSVAPPSEAGPRGTRPCFRSRTDAAAHCCTGFTLGG